MQFVPVRTLPGRCLGNPRDPTERASRKAADVSPDGQTDTYGAPMRPGDVIRSRSRLQDWNERHGRLGLTLYTFTEIEWTNQNDELVRRRISTGIRY